MSKRNVSYIKPPEPKFLRQLKEKIGYKEGPTIDTKKEKLEAADSDSEGDEQPVVVVLKKGDLTQKEADQYLQEKEETDGVKFKHPKKRSGEKSSKHKTKKKKTDNKSKPKLTNNNLLSFDEEENDD